MHAKHFATDIKLALCGFLQCWAKYEKQSKVIKQNSIGLTFDVSFSMRLYCYCQSFISGRVTGQSYMPPPKFEIFLGFPKILSLLSFGNS